MESTIHQMSKSVYVIVGPERRDASKKSKKR